MKIILIADVTMSLDNVLAVAGRQGEPVSAYLRPVHEHPIVVYTSNLLSP